MRRSFLIRLLAIVLLGGVFGCDGSSSPADAGPDAAAPPDGAIVIPDRVPLALYCELAPTFWCAWLDRCRRGCEPFFEGTGASADGWCSALAAQVDAGRLAYDEARASECLRLAQSELAAICEAGEESRGALHDCLPFEGLGAPGDACVLPFPLEDTCDPSRGTCSALPFADRCPGTCLAHLAEGDACDPTSAGAAACAPELMCIEASCERPPGEGEDCTEEPCADGLRCVVEDAGVATCRSVGGLGDPCEAPEACADGLGCSPDTDQCVETLPRGAACRSDEECADVDHCTAESTCAPRLGAGAVCEDGGCQAGLTCAFDADVGELRCQASAALGDPCDPGICGEGLWCRHAEGERRCAPVGSLEDECAGEPAWSPERRCVSGTFCNDTGKCEAQRGPDEPCDPSLLNVSECDVGAGVLCDPFTDSCLAPGAVEGARCLGVCAESLYCDVDICVPRVALGEPCPPGDTCVSGAACVDLDGEGLRCWAQSSCS